MDSLTHKGRLRIRLSERKFILLLGDLVFSGLALILALFLWSLKDTLNFSWEFLGQRAPAWFYFMPILWVSFLTGLYDIRRANRHGEVLKGIATAAGISILLYLIVFFVSEPNSLPRRGVAIFIGVVTLLTIIWRFIYIKIFTAPVFNRRVLVIGAGLAGTTFASMASRIQPIPFDLVGFIDDDQDKQGREIFGFKVVGDGSSLLDTIKNYEITDLIFAISGDLDPDLFRSILSAEEGGVEVSSLPTTYEELFGRVPVQLLQSDWILRTFLDQIHTNGVYEGVKRLMDIISGILGLLVLAVIFPFVALFILIDSGRPIFYSQMRVGKNGLLYKIFKFRTMRSVDGDDGIGRMTTDKDERITRIGKFLRRSHVDELPQMLNILKGENSLVGPRAEQPELVQQFQEQIPFYRARLLVRPGLTGWAQINQRYASTVEDTIVKLEFDLYYLKHRTLLLDFNIILRTIGAVLGFRGL